MVGFCPLLSDRRSVSHCFSWDAGDSRLSWICDRGLAIERFGGLFLPVAAFLSTSPFCPHLLGALSDCPLVSRRTRDSGALLRRGTGRRVAELGRTGRGLLRSSEASSSIPAPSIARQLNRPVAVGSRAVNGETPKTPLHFSGT